MELPDFNQTNNQEIESLRLYPYKHLTAYIKTSKDDSKYNWHLSNLLGEMYEHLIYEKIRAWANDSDEISEFILKGPYIERNTKVKDGFIYDSRNQIYYMSAGETIGEFDALFKCGRYRYFVEIKQTDNRPLIKTLKYELLRKYNLLKILFPDEEIGCLIITTYKGDINTGKLPNVVIIRTPKYELDPNLLCKTDESKAPLPKLSYKFKTVYQLGYHRFHYSKTLYYIHKNMQDIEPNKIKGKLLKLISPYIGLIERVFLGKVSAPDFNGLLEQYHHRSLQNNLNIEKVYLAIKIKGSSSLSKTIYLKGKKKRYYEISDLNTLKMKIIERRKRATRDIDHLDRSLKQLSMKQAEEYFLTQIR